MKDALMYHANNFKTSFIKNLGNGKFEISALPAVAQLAPIYGMIADDFNGDGNLDLVLCGNDFGNEVNNGRYDAMNGLLLLGNGKGGFFEQSTMKSGIYIPGDAKALIKLKGIDNTYLMAASENRGPLRIFRNKNKTQQLIPLRAEDKEVFYYLKNGQKRKEELYYGSSFLSQSSRFICIDENVTKVVIINSKGVQRVLGYSKY